VKLRRSELKRARIEIIPMIDTIFFLLVYFMITSLAMVQMSAYRVALPQSTTAEGKPVEKVVLTLDNAGRYSIDRQYVTFDQILPDLTARVSDNPYITIVINVDKDQSVQNFLSVMNLGQEANPGDLVIATSPTKRS
jgi:biopolymer transport protein ExbD